MLVNDIIASEVIFWFMLEYNMATCLVNYDFNNFRLILIMSLFLPLI